MLYVGYVQFAAAIIDANEHLLPKSFVRIVIIQTFFNRISISDVNLGKLERNYFTQNINTGLTKLLHQPGGFKTCSWADNNIALPIRVSPHNPNTICITVGNFNVQCYLFICAHNLFLLAHNPNYGTEGARTKINYERR